MAHGYNASTWEAEGFQDSLGYIVRSRLVWAKSETLSPSKQANKTIFGYSSFAFQGDDS